MGRLRDDVQAYGILCGIILCNLFSISIFAQDVGPLAIIGGQGPAPYAAFIESDGSVKPISGLPPTGLTYRVAINSSGEGLIGGTNALNAYAALVAPDGTLTSIGGLIAPGEIYTVAINESGTGMIGGGHLTSNIPYAAIVSPNGTATSFAGLPASGLIFSVAIQDSGKGVLGGIGPLNSAYAALTSPNGTLTPLIGLPANGGIFWVDVNDSGTSFIGGKANTSAYAAFVASNGTVDPVVGLPPGLIYSVAINDPGRGIVGGTAFTLPYAALISPSGSVTTLAGLPGTPGIIYNVRLNDSGTGLIAGFSASGPFGSFVAPNGSLTPLIGLPTGSGFLDGAALHSSGVGIVGGVSFGAPFVALAAPNGHLTYLDGLPPLGEINSIAIAMLDPLVPKSIGPFDSWANTQFTLSSALTQHCMIHHKNLDPCDCCEQLETSSLWFAPFGNYVRKRAHHAIPTISNEIGGALIGFDYRGIQDVVFGGGLAYAYNNVRYSKHLGHAAINQESAVLYASWDKPHFYLNVALWGGIFQSSHKRKSFSFITSKASPSGWNLSPHLELSTPFSIPSCQGVDVEPFVAFDWANHWQNHFRERGSSGFNITLNDQYASILRSEIGVRFYETFQYDWGLLVVEEKGSYVNRTPFHDGKGTASFIGAFTSFDVETLNTSGYNNGLFELHVECLPSCLVNFYASLDYQGEFGSSFQSQTLTFTLGKDF